MLDVPATPESVEFDALELAVGFKNPRRIVFAEAMQLGQHRDKVCIGIYEPLRDGFQVSGGLAKIVYLFRRTFTLSGHEGSRNENRVVHEQRY